MGRSDGSAAVPRGRPSRWAAETLAKSDLRLCSPARRCAQTAAWLGGDWQSHAQLWEQDFGAWEGRAYADLPDLGPLDRASLAAHTPPQGESFLQVAARTKAVWAELPERGRIAVVAHAGIIRAALGLALHCPEAGLAFRIDPLSITHLIEVEGLWAIQSVNLPLCEVKA